ncbi:MAG: transcriptional regulator, GntR family [Verrucomicrobia bacterium]|nr:transcriptional regulator, GntR family [Verrucomicrobiota bacterium]
MVNVDYSKAYKYIRERILSGEYARGFPLKPDVLAKEIGMSRTPIRDALRQLDGDGLVSIRPRIGASVRSIDVDEYAEICGMRLGLEIYSVGLAAKLRTESDLKEIAFACEAVARETERLIQATDAEKHHMENLTSELLIREDIHFHMAITSAAKNRLIGREILRNHLITRIVSVSTMLTSKSFLPVNRSEALTMARTTVSEHRLIYNAIERQDVAVARNAMEMHLQQDVDTLIRRLGRNESGEIAGNLATGRGAAS